MKAQDPLRTSRFFGCVILKPHKTPKENRHQRIHYTELIHKKTDEENNNLPLTNGKSIVKYLKLLEY